MDTLIGSVDGASKPASNGVVGSPPSSHPSSITPCASQATLGRHLARRLVQIGVSDVFTVPGDFNLTLLDHLIVEPGLTNVGCCNELNEGYIADGYARSRHDGDKQRKVVAGSSARRIYMYILIAFFFPIRSIIRQ